jgi:hypothetical protein
MLLLGAGFWLGLTLALGGAGLADSLPVKGDQKVRVTLKNGGIFEGVTRQGIHFERLEDGFFRSVSETEAKWGDGIRVWYPGMARGFVYLRKGDILEIVPLDTIGEDQVAAMRTEVEESSRKALEASATIQRLRDEMRANALARTSVSDAAAAAATPVLELPERSPGEYPLLDRFPPEEGWGVAKAERIDERKWTIGVFPSSDERAFLAVLDTWRDQLASWGATAVEVLPEPSRAEDVLANNGTAEEEQTASLPPSQPAAIFSGEKRDGSSLPIPKVAPASALPPGAPIASDVASEAVNERKATLGPFVPVPVTPKKDAGTGTLVDPRAPAKSSTSKPIPEEPVPTPQAPPR